MKKITDRPGRYFGVFIFAPVLFYCSIIVRKNHEYVSNTLIFFSTLLFVEKKCFGFVIKSIEL